MSGSKEQSGNTQEAAAGTTTLGAGQAMPTSGCSPASLNSPMSSCGSRVSFECGSLEKFMEAWGEPSPEGQQLAEKRQGVDTEQAAGGTCRRRRSSSSGGTNFRPISSGGNDGYDGYDVTSTVGAKRRSSSASSGFQSPSGKYGGFSDFMLPMTMTRRNSPSMLDLCNSISIMGDGGGSAVGGSSMESEQQGVGMSASASLSRSPKRKRSNGQLAPYADENGAPSPYPSNGESKTSSQVLSNSSLMVQNDGAYMQITYDESHRFAADEEPGPSGAPQASAWGESLMNDSFLATPEHHHPLDHPRSFEPQSGQRRDIDQALSLLQLSVGSASGDGGGSGSGLKRHNRLSHLSMSTRPELRNDAQGSSDIGIDKEGIIKAEVQQHFMVATAPPEFRAPHAAEAAPLETTEAPQALALTPAPSSGDVLERNPWLAPEPKESLTRGGTLSQPLTPPIPNHPGVVETAEARAAARRLLSPPERHPPPEASRRFPATRGQSSASALEEVFEGKIIRGAGSRGGVENGDARGGGDEERDKEALERGGFGGGLSTRSKGNKLKAKTKGKGKGAVGGQRPAVQAPVSTPRGAKGGGPGSFCSKPEALSQLDTSQSDLMVLDADLWIVRERGDVCSSDECIYKDKQTGVSSRRHYHATCDHRHKGGPKGGMIFHHHQLEKIQKHQRAHIRTLHKKTPAEAVLTGANVEPYLPDDWSDHETKVLEHLVGLYGSTSNWNVIAAGVASKSETQCMLHWRFALNGNATVKGTGTWQPVEDERMLSLVQVFGQRWSTVAEHMPGRLAKQCRERYLNNLDPELRRGTWSREEDEKLLTLRGQENKSFAKIAEQIDGRSYNDVKNRWSQISRQIASLKKTTGKKGRRLSPKTLAAAAVLTDANTTTSGNANSNIETPDKLYFGRWRDASGRGDCSPKSDASETSREGTGTGPQAKAPANALAGGSKYRVCVNGGIPTLRESSGAEEGERGSEDGNEVGRGKLQQQQQPQPPDGGSGVRDRGQGPPSSRSSSDSGSSPVLLNHHNSGHHDAFIGMRMDGTLVGVHEEARSGVEAEAAPDSDLVGPMSDAGGTLFVFGNELRVSI